MGKRSVIVVPETIVENEPVLSFAEFCLDGGVEDRMKALMQRYFEKHNIRQLTRAAWKSECARVRAMSPRDLEG